MRSPKHGLRADEFGDFQTPPPLAAEVCRLLERRGLAPASVVEPTCGIGHFLVAAVDAFPTADHALGVEINAEHVDRLRKTLRTRLDAGKWRVIRESFFQVDWSATLRGLPDPILVIGNPPWITNASLGVLGSENLPPKTNSQNHNGLDAITGKSNFDISEWMLVRLLESLQGREGTLAMLCKTAVARKVLVHAWKNGIGLKDSEIRPIDALTHFDVAVDACLLVCSSSASLASYDCRVSRSWDDREPNAVIGYRDDRLLADVAAFERWKHLGGDEVYRWRSGVKHDCAKVMELRREGSRFRNGHGDLVVLEEDYVFPMLKSSELAKGTTKDPSRWMIVTQASVGAGTAGIRQRAPKTWEYLRQNGEALDRRASAIYRNRPRFSVFGVGEYTFSPWKVAISGFYKRLEFAIVGNISGKPIVLDDTGYFVPCRSEEESRLVASLLNSDAAREFLAAFVFWDAKRPVTVDLLRRLDLLALARELGREAELRRFLVETSEGQIVELCS